MLVKYKKRVVWFALVKYKERVVWFSLIIDEFIRDSKISCNTSNIMLVDLFSCMNSYTISVSYSLGYLLNFLPSRFPGTHAIFFIHSEI